MRIEFEWTTDATGKYVRATACHFLLAQPIVGDWMRTKAAALRSLARRIADRVAEVPVALLRLGGSSESIEDLP